MQMEDSSSWRFFALIIGTEILNGRRRDKHFEFIRDTLAKRGFRFSGSFTIEDDPKLIVDTIKFIASIPNSVIFSFGGIGSTPDDHTRVSAAKALRDGKLYRHSEAEKIILDRLGDRAYPYPIRMADLPEGAKLLENPINRMPAFYLDDRFFFMPGFPQMSHPMVEWALDNIFGGSAKKAYRKTLLADCRESELIDIMERLPEDVELSSLPKLTDEGFKVSISLSSYNQESLDRAFSMFIDRLKQKNIVFVEESC